MDFRATAARQNAVALVPVAALARVMPFAVADPWKAGGAVAAVVLLNATLCMTLYVRAINTYGAAAVVMLFAPVVRPAPSTRSSRRRPTAASHRSGP